MGVRDPVQRTFPVHQQFVRRHGCAVPGCKDGPIEFAHLRTAANSGIGIKPPDWYGISLCRAHHRRAHDIGHDAMARENGITLDFLYEMAKKFSRLTTDKDLREAYNEHC